MGATVLGGLVGNLSIPPLKASASATWFAETSAITVADPQTDSVLLTPKHCGGIVSISRNMLQQPSLDVTRMVESDLMKLLAVALDQAALVGGGANQPVGTLAAGSGVPVVTSGASVPNGVLLSWAATINLIGAVDQSNALAGSLGFVTNAKVVKTARATSKVGLSDSFGNYIINDPGSLAGFPLSSSQNVPSNFTKGTGTGLSALIFGDWSSLVLGFWSDLDLLVNAYDSTGYAAGNVLVRAAMTADVELKHVAAFAAMTDLTTP